MCWGSFWGRGVLVWVCIWVWGEGFGGWRWDWMELGKYKEGNARNGKGQNKG